MTDLEIELQHIWLEIEQCRWHKIERFLFSYFCFDNNYITKNNRPCRDIAREYALHSNKVSQIKGTILEPLIPTQTFIGLLKSAKKQQHLTLDYLAILLQQSLEYVVITAEEKIQLDKINLTNSMPKNWYKDGQFNENYPLSEQLSLLLKNKFARMDFAEIFFDNEVTE